MRSVTLVRASAAFFGLSILGFALWAAIHRFPGLGTWLADTARSIVGPAAVARLEDAAYGLEDRWKRVRNADEAPRSYWAVPAASAADVAVAPLSLPADPGPSPLPEGFRPADRAPMDPDKAAPGDGLWVAMPDLRVQDPHPAMYKTLLHPDARRPWSAVAVVAVDLKRVQLFLEPGLYVPESTEPEAYGMARPGLIPAQHQPMLLAAFNGGFKTIHGRYGMHVHGVTLVRGRPHACTVAGLSNGRIVIATWTALPGRPADRVWWRQTPACLLEEGVFGEGVLTDENGNWGTSVHGSTFIRRSAIGIDALGTTLFVGIGDSVSAAGMARSLQHAGASSIAQLDVNWDLPKFLSYSPDEAKQGALRPKPLYDGLQYTKGEYIGKAAPRDFFYIVYKQPNS